MLEGVPSSFGSGAWIRMLSTTRVSGFGFREGPMTRRWTGVQPRRGSGCSSRSGRRSSIAAVTRAIRLGWVSEFRVSVLGVRFRGSGFGVWGLGIRGEVVCSRIQGLGFRVQGGGLRGFGISSVSLISAPILPQRDLARLAP